MIVLGIDPGTATTGYGVIKKDGDRLAILNFGVINTSPKQACHRRLQILYQRLMGLIAVYRPTDVAIEQLFFNTNAATALSVGQARGIALLAAAEAGLNLIEYTPLQVKQAMTGYGRATKRQIQEMVKVLLELAEVPKPDDAADALAVAVCHINSYKMGRKLRVESNKLKSGV